MDKEAELQEFFYARASRLKDAADKIFYIILALLLAGLLVFLFAASVTRSDIPRVNVDTRMSNTKALLSNISTKIEEVSKRISNQEYIFNSVVIPAIEDFTKAHPPPISCNAETMSSAFGINALSNPDQLIEQINNAPFSNPTTGYAKLISFPGRNISVCLTKGGWLELGETIKHKASTIPRRDIDELMKESGQLQADQQLQNEVYNKLYAEKVAETADEGNNANNGMSLTGGTKDVVVSLIQTNITRFGTLTIIIFLVSLLITVYKYYIRLAVFYDARGDALKLRMVVKGDQFSEICDNLTPSHDFGRPPKTPVDQAIEIAKLVVAQKGGGEERREKE